MRLFELARAQKRPPVLSAMTPPGPILEFLKQKTPVAYYSAAKIYRGIEGGPIDILKFGDSNSIERKSTNTDNYYTLLMSNILPEWKSFPKRNRSFICTGDISYTENYSGQYRVFPLGDPVIGICPTQDLWECFPIWLGDFSDIIEILAHHTNTAVSDNMPSLLKFIKHMDKLWPTLTPDNVLTSVIHQSIDKYLKNSEYDKQFNPLNFKSFSQLLSRLLDPSSNDFHLKRLSEISESEIANNEVWFSGPAYFVSHELIN